MQYLRLIKYLIIHKYYVFIKCFKYGIIWRGITHDLSKFFPPEFIPYANRFFSKEKIKDEKWFRARFHHKKTNDHHYEHWCLVNENYKISVFEMSENAVKEMVSDWWGSGKADAEKIDLHKWYEENKNKIVLHSKTRYYVELLLSTIKND